MKGFSGPVDSNRYSAYRRLDRESETIVFVGHWPHGRRYFTDALNLKSLPKKIIKPPKIRLLTRQSSGLGHLASG